MLVCVYVCVCLFVGVFVYVHVCVCVIIIVHIEQLFSTLFKHFSSAIQDNFITFRLRETTSSRAHCLSLYVPPLLPLSPSLSLPLSLSTASNLLLMSSLTLCSQCSSMFSLKNSQEHLQCSHYVYAAWHTQPHKHTRSAHKSSLTAAGNLINLFSLAISAEAQAEGNGQWVASASGWLRALPLDDHADCSVRRGGGRWWKGGARRERIWLVFARFHFECRINYALAKLKICQWLWVSVQKRETEREKRERDRERDKERGRGSNSRQNAATES